MDLWQLIANDHANIADLCGDIPRAMSGDGVRSRERLFDQLHSELRRHMEAEEESLYDALEGYDRTEDLIAELEHEHEEIEIQLEHLARSRDKGSREWTLRFRDLAALVEQHFHREEHELLPAARATLDQATILDLRHDYAEEKIEELRAARHPGWGASSSGLVWGVLAGAAAAGAAAIAWRMSQRRPSGSSARRQSEQFRRRSGMADDSFAHGGEANRPVPGQAFGHGDEAAPHEAASWAGATGSSPDANFSSADPPRAPSGLASGLQPGGVLPGGGPGASVGSLGTGGGQTESRDTGSLKRGGA